MQGEAQDYQVLSDSERLSIKYIGYSFRTYSSLKIYKIGIANLMVLVAFAYMSVRLTRRFLAWMFITFNYTEELMSQLKFELDLSRHLKDDKHKID